MTRNTMRTLLLGATLGGIMLLAGCGPKYPNCETDEHCKDKGQYCVNKVCRDCADDSHCSASNPCKFCGEGYSCQQTEGCCTSDLDCPGGRCWKEPGATMGQCGTFCKDNSHCPPGQICKNGQCVPDCECTADNQCPPGKKCLDCRCVVADCQPEPIYFDFNEYKLTSDSKTKLNSNGDCIKKRNQSVLIEGHCDERGSDEYNLALGENRARAAKKYLENLGVGVGLKTISYGEERPVCTESTEDCWWRNRRAEFNLQ